MRRSAKKQIKISSKETRYLHIWKRFMSYAKSGISINNILYRRPTHIRWDDSCPIGIGGVDLTGKEYCYNLPRHLQGRVSNNALEFLASMLGCWVKILDGSVTPHSCILALADNSSACVWLHKSNFISADHSFHAAIAKKLATLLNSRLPRREITSEPLQL